MTQAELIKKIAASTGTSDQRVGEILNTLGLEVRDQLNKGGEVSLPGIGKLSVKSRAARNGRNPQTGEALVIPAKKVVHFSAAKPLKDAINQ